MMIAKGKIEPLRAHCSLHVCVWHKCPIVTAQLNGDSMDLVFRMQHVAYYTNVLVLHRLAFRKGSGHMPPLRSLAICAGIVVPLETLLAVGCCLRASPGNRDLRIEDSKLL
jgi:hypothetical protein